MISFLILPALNFDKMQRKQEISEKIMNKLFFFFCVFVLVFITSCGNWKHTKGFSYEEYSIDDYQKKLSENSNYLIVDVRTPGEFNKGHIEHAINISYFGSGFREATDKLDKSKLIFMYCETQHRSPLASKIMKKEGFTHIIDLKGGFIKWQKQNMPMVK